MTRISLAQAAEILTQGGIVAVPTETVYGLAASLAHPEAIDNIFRLKGRPSNNPLIIHVASTGGIKPYIRAFPPNFPELTHVFWPGPLTLVLPIVEETIPSRARANLATAAFRVPSHPLAQALLKKTGPLVMPSANLSGTPSATAPQHVESDFGHDFPVLDGGSSQQGLESTILTYLHDRWQIIRLGAIAAEEFHDILGYIPIFTNKGGGESPLCPGQLFKHYAPKALLELTTQIHKGMKGIIIGFSDRNYPADMKVLSLGNSSFPEQAGERLYHLLRWLDQHNIEQVWVDMNFPDTGLWKTLRERLYKAASKN